jgi:hypothetical protein
MAAFQTFDFSHRVLYDSTSMMRNLALAFHHEKASRAAGREDIMTEEFSRKSESHPEYNKAAVPPECREQRPGMKPESEPLRRRCLAFAVSFILALPALPLHAREDSARLVFEKTAGIGSRQVHRVSKGECIDLIIRNRFGDTPPSRSLIRRLNPDIPDLNRIYPGQKIVLPESLPGAGDEDAAPSVTYQVKKGDSLSRIVRSELNLSPREVYPAYRLIRKLNPGISDLDRIQAGQILRLPASSATASKPSPSQTTAAAPREESGIKTEVKMSVAGDFLSRIIRPVIGRMRGAVTIKGNYFIPLRENTQITIDCAQIPVVELTDGTTVLLDFGDRLSENLKALIRQSWTNYAFLGANDLRDELWALYAIIRQSPNFTIGRADKPVALAAKPETFISPDWIIYGKDSTGGSAYSQGLFMLNKDETLLPADVRTFIEKSGVIVTEIVDGRVVSYKDTPSAARLAVTDLRNLTGGVLAERFLTALGETPERNAEVTVFNQERDGFNLTVTADLLLRKGEKRFIFQMRRIPEQFVQVLKKADTEIVTIGMKDQGRPLIETVLQVLGMPCSFGLFSFRIPEEENKRPRLTASFSSLRTMKEGEPVYLIDFDVPPSGLPFISGKSEVRFIRY